MQMLWTNTRMDKLAVAQQAFTELRMMDSTTSSYTTMVLRGEEPQPRAPATDDDSDDDDNNGPDLGPKSLSSIALAHMLGMFSLPFSHQSLTL